MAEETRKVKLVLKLSSLTMKVDASTKIYVMWKRGEKTAQTKSFILSEDVSTIVLGEEFEISTEIKYNTEINRPCQSKKSQIFVICKKGKEQTRLGETKLDLGNHGVGEFLLNKLPIEKCPTDPNAFIEV